MIVECQSELPSDEDIKRFFQYVSSLRVFKDSNVVLYILCTKKAPYSKREFVINDDCIYTMHVISLKDFKAEEIFKSIEDKLNNNEKITDEDIASLQLIIYTDFRESQLEVLNRARALIDEISDCGNFDINEKSAIIYLFEVLNVNMLDKDDHDKYMEVNKMLINPRERYIREEAIKEGEKNGKDEAKLEFARIMLNDGYSIDEIVKIFGLPKKDILNAK